MWEFAATGRPPRHTIRDTCGALTVRISSLRTFQLGFRRLDAYAYGNGFL
jgi:hypothetical protein